MKIVPCIKTLIVGLFLIFISCNNQPAQSDVKFKFSDLWNKKTPAQMAKKGDYLETAAASTAKVATSPKIISLTGDITGELGSATLKSFNVPPTLALSNAFNLKQQPIRSKEIAASFNLVPRGSSDLPIEMMIMGDKNTLTMKMPLQLAGEALADHRLRVRESLALYLSAMKKNKAFKEGDLLISTGRDQFGVTFFKITKNPDSQLTIFDLNDSLNFLNEQYQAVKFNYD
jgi:hypothetical protein